VPDSESGDAVELRASDRDREQTAARLRTAAATGQLDVEELEERLTTAFGSRTRRELAALTADLGEPHEGDVTAAAPLTPVVHTDEGGERWVVSVMSGNDRAGHWRLGRRVRVVNVMGGSDLDLTQAELSAPVTQITVVSVMGGSEIAVPEGVRVEASRFAFMGGNDVKLGPERPPGDAPVLRIKLFAFMGGNELFRGKKKSRTERRLEREHRRELEDGDR
jgi:hypothetical protein